MNGKLIGLLIRSNAAMIEAISASARLTDKDGTYDENLFGVCVRRLLLWQRKLKQ